MIKPLNRRTFLRGSGVAIALPMLEAMTPFSPTQAAEPALSGKPVKRMVVLSNNYGIYHKAFFPDPTDSGKDYKLSETLSHLERHRRDFTVFSNLDHGIGGGHACVPTLLNGIRPYLAANYPEGNISMDQKAAELVGAATRFPSMTVKVNESNLVSFTRTGVQVPAIDVRQMWRALFLDESAATKNRATETLARPPQAENRPPRTKARPRH